MRAVLCLMAIPIHTSLLPKQTDELIAPAWQPRSRRLVIQTGAAASLLPREHMGAHINAQALSFCLQNLIHLSPHTNHTITLSLPR